MFTWQAAAIILVVLIVLVLALAIAIYRLALNFALQAIRPKPVRYGAVLSEEVTRNHLDASLMDLKYDKLFLTNRRGQELTARLYPTASQTDRYILFVHGYNYPWIGALKYLRMLLNLGFNVFVPDMQAQGESQGDYITFGALESDDCLEWLSQIQKCAQTNGFDRARIGIMGESMGAVTALMSMAKVNFSELPLENRPLFCIADCPFSDWDSQMVLQGQKRFGFNPSPLLPLVKSIIRRRAGADMDEVSAVKAAAAIKVPVLLFHGTADPLVPYTMSQEIAKANPDITLCLIEGAKHMNCYTTNPEEYRRQIEALLEKVRFADEIAEEISVYL